MLLEIFTQTDVSRFWRVVDCGDVCWMWRAGLDRDGYGKFHAAGRHLKAHRFSWQLHHGPIPTGLFVCHRCDNPGCVRPDHLFLGTASDNNKDCAAKGRHVFGERNGRSKLTVDQVREIRARHADGESQGSLAKQFGISHRSIQFIVRQIHWKHVTAAETKPAA
jgi:hypothetical protein